MARPLMPMATAVWLVDNTTLTFRQIARFCDLHVLEVQGIADETVGQNIVGQDPTLAGQLTWEEIERCQKDPAAELKIIVDEVPAAPRTKGPRYTPVSKRQDKPNAIAWLLRHHSELSDAQIGRLIGTTKPTIEAIRTRSHWNIQNIQPKDPVSLGLCTQIELDDAVRKAQAKAKREAPPPEKEPAVAPAETPAPSGEGEEPAAGAPEAAPDDKPEVPEAPAEEAAQPEPESGPEPSPSAEAEAEPAPSGEDETGKPAAGPESRE